MDPDEEWFENLEDDYPDAEATLRRLLAENEATSKLMAVRFAISLTPFWDRKGMYDIGRPFLNTIIASLDTAISLRLQAALMNCAGTLAWRQSAHEEALRFFEKSRALCENNEELWEQLASALNGLGNVLRDLNRTAEARTYFEKLLVLDQMHNNQIGAAKTQNNLGLVEWKEGNYAQALKCFQRTYDIWSQGNLKGSKQGIANVRLNTLIVLVEQGERPVKREDYLKVMALYDELKDKPGLARAYNNLGWAYKKKAEIEHALECYYDSLKIANDIGAMDNVVNTILEIAEVVMERQPAQSAQLFGAAQVLDSLKGREASNISFDADDPVLLKLRSLLDDHAYQTAWQEGSRFSQSEAVLLALSLANT